ncbi:hypothetical protein Trco_000305 [Trichoderma cornu-damae]|uniref:Uncharacterized protein n=1 Tax=Trichoderma cornu-damae TaxID=654480 RepID=A0A9P8QRP5_9HYPO|nr:hypothetical protein Trco_000305 [Trichoderma cornu-damae]
MEKRLGLLRDDSVVVGDSDLITSAVIEVLFIVLDNLARTPLAGVRGGGGAGVLTIITLSSRQAAVASASARAGPRFGILGKLQAVDGSLALVRNVADDVGDGVRLVLEVAVGHVDEAGRRQPLAAAGRPQGVGVGAVVLLIRLVAALDLADELIRLGEGLDEVLHVVALAANQAAQVQDDAASLVALAHDGGVGVVELSKLLLVPLALPLELLGNLLLQNEGLEGVVALLLRAGEAGRQAAVVLLLLVDEGGEAAVLALVALDLDLEVLGLLGELLGKGLELEELLLPALELLHEVVVPLGDLAELGVHAPLQVDEVLPGLEGIARVLVPLADDLVEVPHRHLGHEGLLDGASEDGLDARVAAHLLAHVVHDGHDGVLVPPLGVLDGLDLAAHDDDLAGGHQLAAAVGGAEVLGDPGGRDVAVEGLGQAGDKLVALAGGQGSGGAGREDKVAVQIDDQGVGGGGEERAALGRDAQDVGARLLDELLGVARVHHGDVQAAPFKHADAVPHSLGGDGEHGRIVTDEDDATSGGDGGLDDADNVGDGQAVEEGPHGEVLEAGGRRGELVAEGVVLHVDADEVVEPRGREAQDAGDLLGVEQVGGLVPVNPHAAQVIAQEVVQGVAGQERQAVGNPVGLLRVVVVVGLGPLPQVTDRLGPLLVGPRPNAQADAVEGMGRVLLEDEGMSPRNVIVLLQPGAAAQDLGEPELPDGALHVGDFALGRSGSLDPLGGLAADSADHVGVRERLRGALLRLLGQGGGDGLGDAGMERRGAARYHHGRFGAGLVASAGPAITVASSGARKRRMGVERRRHGERTSTTVFGIELPQDACRSSVQQKGQEKKWELGYLSGPSEVVLDLTEIGTKREKERWWHSRRGDGLEKKEEEEEGWRRDDL